MKFIKRTKLEKYFNDFVENNNSEIIKVCTLGENGGNTESPIKYMLDEPLYIIFKNYYALIIEYYDVCDIKIEYRQLTENEKYDIASIHCADFFNRVDDVHNGYTLQLSKRITTIMEYDSLEKIEVRYFEGEYDTWENGSLITKDGTSENFDEIVFYMKNQNTIHIKPEPAEMDGYLDVWSEENFCNIKNYN